MTKQVDQTTRAIITVAVFCFIFFITFVAISKGRDKSYSPVAEEDTPVSDQCVITNCHGLDITCGARGPEMCTMMYGFGDRCREHAQCGVIDGKCQPITNDAFEKCVACVRECETTDPDQMPDAFLCESQC
jgi:hypothetical protein